MEFEEVSGTDKNGVKYIDGWGETGTPGEAPPAPADIKTGADYTPVTPKVDAVTGTPSMSPGDAGYVEPLAGSPEVEGKMGEYQAYLKHFERMRETEDVEAAKLLKEEDYAADRAAEDRALAIGRGRKFG